MKPNLIVKVALTLFIAGVIAFGFSFRSSAPAWAGLGDEENDGRLGEGTSLLGGSIDLLNCDDGSIATWRQSTITFKIVNSTKANDATIKSVRAGILEWNNVRGPYTLSEVSSGSADITVELVSELGSPKALGSAWGECKSGRTGITSFEVSLKTAGLPRVGIRNLAAHEIGHALGLGHSDRTGDLMSPTYDKFIDGTLLVCPSNLDVGGLTSKKDPHRILPVLWLMLPVC